MFSVIFAASLKTMEILFLAIDLFNQNRSLSCFPEPKTCKDAFNQGARSSGIYRIKPDNGPSFQVFCDMITDGGGWTVFQRRKDGTENFYRNWLAYRNGFGTLNGNFWLGLERIHRLTAIGRSTTLKIEVRHRNGKNGYAKYTAFRVSGESNKYKLTYAGYSGNAGDSLAYQNGMFFSTYDKDNDKDSGRSCAVNFRGAWWYKDCFHSNLNADYPPSSGSTDPRFMSWYHLTSSNGNIVFSVMKIK